MANTQPFDEHWKEYEDWFAKNRFVYLSELRAVRHFVPRQGEGFEIGIGSGRFAAPLGIRYGVEPSRAMRRLAERKGLTVWDGVAEHLPFPDERFGYALIVTTICFVDDIDATMREAFRVLTDGGRIIIGFVDRASELGKRYERHKAQSRFYRLAVFYTAENVLDLLEDYGFCDAEVVQTVFGEVSEIDSVHEYREGHGTGGFVVISAVKKPPGTAGSHNGA